MTEADFLIGECTATVFDPDNAGAPPPKSDKAPREGTQRFNDRSLLMTPKTGDGRPKGLPDPMAVVARMDAKIDAVWNAHVNLDGKMYRKIEAQEWIRSSPVQVKDPSNPQITMDKVVDGNVVYYPPACRGAICDGEPTSGVHFTFAGVEDPETRKVNYKGATAVVKTLDGNLVTLGLKKPQFNATSIVRVPGKLAPDEWLVNHASKAARGTPATWEDGSPVIDETTGGRVFRTWSTKDIPRHSTVIAVMSFKRFTVPKDKSVYRKVFGVKELIFCGEDEALEVEAASSTMCGISLVEADDAEVDLKRGREESPPKRDSGIEALLEGFDDE